MDLCLFSKQLVEAHHFRCKLISCPYYLSPGLFFQNIWASQFQECPKVMVQIKSFCGSYIIVTSEPFGKNLSVISHSKNERLLCLLNKNIFLSALGTKEKKFQCISFETCGKMEAQSFTVLSVKFWHALHHVG